MERSTHLVPDRATRTGSEAPLPLNGGRRGWLRRLGGRIIARELTSATQAIVRREKYASALIMSLRIARELEGPMRDLQRHISMLDRLALQEPEISHVAAGLRQDRGEILRAIERLGAIEPPAGAGV